LPSGVGEVEVGRKENRSYSLTRGTFRRFAADGWICVRDKQPIFSMIAANMPCVASEDTSLSQQTLN